MLELFNTNQTYVEYKTVVAKAKTIGYVGYMIISMRIDRCLSIYIIRE